MEDIVVFDIDGVVELPNIGEKVFKPLSESGVVIAFWTINDLENAKKILHEAGLDKFSKIIINDTNLRNIRDWLTIDKLKEKVIQEIGAMGFPARSKRRSVFQENLLDRGSVYERLRETAPIWVSFMEENANRFIKCPAIFFGEDKKDNRKLLVESDTYSIRKGIPNRNEFQIKVYKKLAQDSNLGLGYSLIFTPEASTSGAWSSTDLEQQVSREQVVDKLAEVVLKWAKGDGGRIVLDLSQEMGIIGSPEGNSINTEGQRPMGGNINRERK